MESTSEYAWALPFLGALTTPGAVRGVAEVGSRDAMDALYLRDQFKAPVFAFEPDPINFATCRENVAAHGGGVELFELALSNEDGERQFLAIDRQKYDNPGAGGFYEINFAHRPSKDPDKNRASIQTPIKVQTRRFDSLDLPAVDLLAMDVQGAELVVLQGFGAKLAALKAVILETSLSNNYLGAATFSQIHEFLTGAGFSYVASSRFGRRLPRDHLFDRLLGRHTPHIPDFNCVYVKG